MRIANFVRKWLGMPPLSGNGWRPWVHEPFAGAWQRGIRGPRMRGDVTANSAVFACVRLIASDISKLPLTLTEEQPDGTWREASSRTSGGAVKLASHLPPELLGVPAILRRPNTYQTRQQLIASWVTSLQLCGNAYVYPQRRRGTLVAFHVLDPARVMPLVSPSGDVLYRIQSDNLAGEPQEFYLDSSELMHDRINALFHPLCGVSPLHASAAVAGAASAALGNAEHFFGNQSTPGGVLEAPGPIADETAARLKESMATFRAEHAGETLVLADGLKFSPLALSNEASQLVELLELSAADVARAFGVPGFMIGASAVPAGLSVEALTSMYFSTTLQTLVEGIEGQLDRAFNLSPWLAFEFDLDALVRMDKAGEIARLKEAVGAAIMAPNEARLRLNLPPVEGGGNPLAQQQNYSLAALAKRDARDDPFASPSQVAAEKHLRTIEQLQVRQYMLDRERGGERAAPAAAADPGYLTRADVPPEPRLSMRTRRQLVKARQREVMRQYFDETQ